MGVQSSWCRGRRLPTGHFTPNRRCVRRAHRMRCLLRSIPSGTTTLLISPGGLAVGTHTAGPPPEASRVLTTWMKTTQVRNCSLCEAEYVPEPLIDFKISPDTDKSTAGKPKRAKAGAQPPEDEDKPKQGVQMAGATI